MKIAIVLNTSWNIYNFRMNFIKSLLAEGHEVHTVAPVDDYTQRLQLAGCIHHGVTMDSRGANPIRDFGLIIELWSIYRKMKPDIILHYTIKPNIYGTLAASMLNIPVINNVCGLGTVFLKKGLVSVVAMKLYRWAFRYPKKVFFQNSDDRKLFLDRKLVPSDIADLIPGSGVDLKRFTPGTQARNEKFTFLLISRLITDKGVLEFIDAVKELKSKGFEAKFQILGPKDPEHKRGIKLKTIDEWIRAGFIEYLGITDDVRQYINKADCIVLPSYREGTPRTLLEAASSAKPIIATDVPGCHHVVVDQYNGLLCQMKDSGDLAEKMKTMAGLDENTLKQMGTNGRRKMELEFSEDIVIRKYIAAILPFKKAS
ncbi:MAG TPA: glycosyltransferase family 4 protein [Cyclobacteriaceae bacterium]|nr:glycosyltransferase family 4 protein [Cyclobacteriaceae bacterium]